MPTVFLAENCNNNSPTSDIQDFFLTPTLMNFARQTLKMDDDSLGEETDESCFQCK